MGAKQILSSTFKGGRWSDINSSATAIFFDGRKFIYLFNGRPYIAQVIGPERTGANICCIFMERCRLEGVCN